MRLSEMQGGTGPREEWTLPYPRSQDADPPISVEEARNADTAICCWHDGLIRQTGDVEGRVFFSPVGSAYWRYTKHRANAGMYAPLDYQDSGSGII